MEEKNETKNDELLENTAKEGSHQTHSFQWSSGKTTTSITCNKAGTVEDRLKTSSQFREIAKKNIDKELVIVRGGKAITAHCPCSLIKKERLTIKYVKAVQKQKKQTSTFVYSQRKRASGELVMFHVQTKGGRNIVKILKNQSLTKVVQEMTVYAYKGEKVKKALKRDGRFLNTVFSRNCVLSHISTEVNTEMSNLVDDLDNETYKIILLNKSNPPESLSGSLDDAYMTPTESQESEFIENQDSQQSTKTDALTDDGPLKKRKLNNNASGKILCEIPNSEAMKGHLSSQFKQIMTKKESGVPRSKNFLQVEFGKNAQTSIDIKIMKKLTRLSNNVCQVRINGSPAGTGFLLFDKFVLTNAHVLKDIYNVNRPQLNDRVTVNFSYESLDGGEGGQVSGPDLFVDEVTGYEFWPDVSGHMYDWALLRLNTELQFTDVLLNNFAFPPMSGGIYIIGHPEAGVKKMDLCMIISSDDCWQDNLKYISNRAYMETLMYASCFYDGSSGSPVFDNYGRVIAMHSGGFNEFSESGELYHVVEYGYPLFLIMEHVIVQMVEKGRFDVLRAYLACSFQHHQDLMLSVKKLVESRNIVAFKNAINNTVITKDKSLKSFFEFFFQKEKPVPMEIDCLGLHL